MDKLIHNDNQISDKQKVNKNSLITFVDDDCKAEVFSMLYPIFKKKGEVFSAALVTGKLDTPGRMTSGQVKELISGGHEMLGHTHNAHNDNMLDYSLEYLEKDILKCREELYKLGSSSMGFVYPQGRSSVKIRRIVKKSFDFAFSSVGINTNKNVERMNLKRLGFGMWGSGDDLEAYKEQVDDLVAEGGWLTYMVHTGIGPTSEEELALLPELIDYIQSKGIDIVNASEGYAVYGTGEKKNVSLKILELIKEKLKLIVYKVRKGFKKYT